MHIHGELVELSSGSEGNRFTILVQKSAKETERFVVFKHLLDSIRFFDKVRIALLLVEFSDKCSCRIYIFATFDELKFPFAISLKMLDMIAL